MVNVCTSRTELYTTSLLRRTRVTVTEEVLHVTEEVLHVTEEVLHVTEEVLHVTEDKVCFFLFIALCRMQNPTGG